MPISHNYGQFSARTRESVRRWDGALHRAMQRIGAKVERGMNTRLSGGGQPGAYPVPRRTGHLARSGASVAQTRSAAIFNTAEYAASVHNGYRAYGNPHAPYYGPRRFLEDAATQDVDPMAEVVAELQRVLP